MHGRKKTIEPENSRIPDRVKSNEEI